MYVVGHTYINIYGGFASHEVVGRHLLGFSQLGPIRFYGFCIACFVVGQLHDVEGEGLLPACAPIVYHDGEQLAVLVGARCVCLALIPDGSANSIGDEGRNHGVEENTGSVLVVCGVFGHRVHLAEGQRGVDLPFAGKTDGFGAADQRKCHFARLAPDAGSSREVEIVDGDLSGTFLYESGGNDVAAGMLISVGGTHKLAVEEGNIIVVYLSQSDFEWLSCPVGGYLDGFTEPKSAIVLVVAGACEHGRTVGGFPAAVVDTGLCHEVSSARIYGGAALYFIINPLLIIV